MVQRLHRGLGMSNGANAADALCQHRRIPGAAAHEDFLKSPEQRTAAFGVNHAALIYCYLDFQVTFDPGDRIHDGYSSHNFLSSMKMLLFRTPNTSIFIDAEPTLARRPGLRLLPEPKINL
jgi:hypothetical protein